MATSRFGSAFHRRIAGEDARAMIPSCRCRFRDQPGNDELGSG